MQKFALELNAEKTRLIEFGRFAARDWAARGLGKPETFGFLGFARRETGVGVGERERVDARPQEHLRDRHPAAEGRQLVRDRAHVAAVDAHFKAAREAPAEPQFIDGCEKP